MKSRTLIALSLMPSLPMLAAAETHELETITVTSATGFEQNITYAPASISAVTAEELEKKAYSSVLDAVKNMPGVFVSGGGGTEQDIDIRGMSSEFTLYLIDGKPLSSGRNLHAGSQERSGKIAGNLPNIDMIERIEVIRGPMSSLYGSEAMGGVINIITKDVAYEWNGSISTEYTHANNDVSNDGKNISAYINGPLIKDTLSFSLNAFKETTDEGNTDVEDARTKAKINKVGGRLNWKATEKSSLALDYSTTDQDNFETGTDGDDDRDYGQDRSIISIENNYDGGDYTVKSYLQKDSGSSSGAKNQKEDVITLNSNLMYFAEDHNLTLGIDYKTEEFESDLNINQGSIDRWLGAIYAEDEWFISDDFFLTLGARYNYDEYFKGEITPRVYGVYSATSNLTLKGGVSTGYKQPSIMQAVSGYASQVFNRGSYIGVEVGNPDLKPEKSTNIELGFDYTSTEHGFSSSFVAFNTDYKNKMVQEYTCGDRRNTALGCFYNGDNLRFIRHQVNVDEAEIRGIELALHYNLTPTLNINFDYSFTETEQVTGDDAGEPLNDIPRRMTNISLNWDATSKITTWAQYNYRGDIHTSSTTRLPSYEFTDLGLVYKATENLNLKAGIYNVMNTVVTEEDGYNTVLDGRRITAGLNYKF